MEENSFKKQLPDRPLECTECKKNVCVRYTEITSEGFSESCMCQDCPELQKKLYGVKNIPRNIPNVSTNLVCGNCGTTYEEIKKGHHLGCPECYSVFEEIIFLEMQTAGRYPIKKMTKRGSLAHIGRSPGEKLTLTPSSKLIALNEALKDMLNREDYEQAALLRDQIKELNEEQKNDS